MTELLWSSFHTSQQFLQRLKQQISFLLKTKPAHFREEFHLNETLFFMSVRWMVLTCEQLATTMPSMCCGKRHKGSGSRSSGTKASTRKKTCGTPSMWSCTKSRGRAWASVLLAGGGKYLHNYTSTFSEIFVFEGVRNKLLLWNIEGTFCCISNLSCIMLSFSFSFHLFEFYLTLKSGKKRKTQTLKCLRNFTCVKLRKLYVGKQCMLANNLRQ